MKLFLIIINKILSIFLLLKQNLIVFLILILKLFFKHFIIINGIQWNVHLSQAFFSYAAQKSIGVGLARTSSYIENWAIVLRNINELKQCEIREGGNILNCTNYSSDKAADRVN